jgi:hypothetical protein
MPLFLFPTQTNKAELHWTYLLNQQVLEPNKKEQIPNVQAATRISIKPSEFWKLNMPQKSKQLEKWQAEQMC